MNSYDPYTGMSDEQLLQLDAACKSFDQALLNDVPVSIESQIVGLPDELKCPVFRELLAIEIEHRLNGPAPPILDNYLNRFPNWREEVHSAFRELEERCGKGQADSSSWTHRLEVVGNTIGPYKLREQIGEGGMGLVFVAEQEQPVQREVALKIIKPGMDTKEVIARFEAERQALALMSHPSIAHVIDAGATETGRPYFVMELIRGDSVTEFCDEHKLSTTERLKLFVQICQAVQHAHQKGIIHRDIKPSNILVTSDGSVSVPKVIDFGVAKAINQRLTERTIYTQTTQLVGTPMYMSPEQAERSGLDVDTRTDIYSLGVVLYELLTGTTPLSKDQLSSVGYDEMRRIIREEEPPKPSHRLSTLDGNSQSSISHRRAARRSELVQTVRGELDWIVMKAMDKDVTRRYETAGDLASDIQRYLDDDRVLACPPSTAYQFRKYLRRHKVAFAIAALVIVGLLASISGLTVSNFVISKQKHAAELAQSKEKAQRLEAERQQKEADAQRKRADENFQRARQAVDKYFTLVSETKLLDEPGLQPLRKGLIASAIEFYEEQANQHSDDPRVLIDLANIRLRSATIHVQLADANDSLAEFEKAFDLIEQVLTQVPATATEFRNLPGFWTGVRKFGSAWTKGGVRGGVRDASERQRELAVITRGINIWKQLTVAHPDLSLFRRELAFFLRLKTHHHELFGTMKEEQEARAKTEQLLKDLVRQEPENKEVLAELALLTWLKGYETQNIEMMREGIRLVADRDLPALRMDLAVWQHELGWRLLSRGRSSEAIDPFQQAIKISRELAQEFPHIESYELNARWSTSDLATALSKSGRGMEAEQLAAEVVTKTASDYVLRGNVYRSIGQREKAIADYDTALRVGLRGPIPDIGRVGNFLDQRKSHEKAIEFYTHGILTTKGERVSRIYADRGASWAHLRQYDKALADFTSSIEINAWQCEHHLSRLWPKILRESPPDFQAEFLKLADRAIEITGGNGESYITRSLVYLALGQREKAKEDLARGIELDPDFDVRWIQRSLLRELREENNLD